MSMTDSQTTKPTDPTATDTGSGLDLQLDPDEAQFFLSWTGINTIEELKSHILGIRDEALEVHAYPCIRRFLFVRSVGIVFIIKFEASKGQESDINRV
jgi:hypothetical protein